MRSLLILLVVLALVAIGADRLAVRIAESKIAGGIKQTQNLSTTPSVSIAGFPFLTQLVSDHFHGVTVKVSDLSGSGAQAKSSVRIQTLTAKATDVRTSRNFKKVTAGTVTGTAVFTYQDLSAALGASLSYGGSGADGHGRVAVTGSVTVLGQKISGKAAAEVVLTGVNKIGFTAVTVEGVSVPQLAITALTAVFSHDFTANSLPAGLSIRSITANPDGVQAVVGGSNVVLNQ
jgi:hypothetical protein